MPDTLAPGVYVTESLPMHWIVSTIGGDRWIVDTQPGGWERRVPYKGHVAGLAATQTSGFRTAVMISGVPAEEVGGQPPGTEWYTAEEAAAVTGTAASGWRNRAAAGDIPGAWKVAKTWLIPVAAVRDRAQAGE